MPGKVSIQASGSIRVPADAFIPDETPTTILRINICNIFQDAQRSTAGHRKLVTRLRKIQVSCVVEPTHLGGKGIDNFNEDDFNVEIARCVLRLMGVKRSESAGDRVIRFLGAFLRHANEKDAALLSNAGLDEADPLPETGSTRLTSYLLSTLLQLLASKEKIVRYRSTQLLAHIVNSLDSIDDEYYHLLRSGLLKRITDKEPTIRVQAILGLGRLAGNEDEEEQESYNSDSDEASGLIEKLLDVLQNDPSADVRRSLLLNLPITPNTLPYLLERARDLDVSVRRALYTRLLPALGDFRHLSLSMREKLLRWGLRDRDDQVCKAAARLFREHWVEDCASSRSKNGESEQEDNALLSFDSLLELLERIDVVNSGTEGGIGSEAMRHFWLGRPDYQSTLNLNDAFWDFLTPESVFAARTFNEYCRQQSSEKFDSMVEEKLPEVSKLAFILQNYTNRLVESLGRNDQGNAEDQEDTGEQEFIVEQLLHMAKTLDYSDEVGRRQMFSWLRETLALAQLPEEITKLVVDVLRGICGNSDAGERDFCGVVLEAVAEVHDTVAAEEQLGDVEDESFHSALSAQISDTTPASSKESRLLSNDPAPTGGDDEAKAIREIVVNMKCLHIAQCMLQNIEGSLQQNMHLVTMLNNLVVPAVRSHEAPIRERGLLCLGLCCLLDKTLADENLTLFLHCFTKGHDALQVTAIQILADISAMHSSLLADESDESSKKSILKIFAKGLKAQYCPAVQSAATIAVCKMMLTSIINDEDLLKQLVICYFDPITKSNAGVRQALSYFIPVYCHSKRENMERMVIVAAEVIHAVVDLSEELEEGEDMVSLNIVGNMLVDWTDARKLVVQEASTHGWDEVRNQEVQAVSGDIHLELAESLLEQALNHSCSKEEKKVLMTMIGKLYVTANSSTKKLQAVIDRVDEAIDKKIANDAGSRSILKKLQSALTKAMGEAGKGSDNRDNTLAGESLSSAEDQEMRTANNQTVKIEAPELPGVTEAADSIVEELLEDDDDLGLPQVRDIILTSHDVIEHKCT